MIECIIIYYIFFYIYLLFILLFIIIHYSPVTCQTQLKLVSEKVP